MQRAPGSAAVEARYTSYHSPELVHLGPATTTPTMMKRRRLKKKNGNKKIKPGKCGLFRFVAGQKNNVISDYSNRKK